MRYEVCRIAGASEHAVEFAVLDTQTQKIVTIFKGKFGFVLAQDQAHILEMREP